MRSLTRLVATASLALAGAALPGAAPAVAADAVPGQVIAGFRAGTSRERIDEVVERAGGRTARRLDVIRAVVVRPRQGGGTGALRRRLLELRAVRYAEPDFHLRASKAPDDPLYPLQYALGTSGAGISAPAAWNVRTSCGKVAVLDSGVQHGHPDLEGNVWHNPDEIKGNGKDDDRNGYVDDYWGVNVRKGSGSGGDGDGHGTHVAGIVAGRGNNAIGVSGVCWSASVMPVRFMDDRGRGSTSDAIAGLQYAMKEGAKVVNCSFGSSSKSDALKDAVKKAKDRGVLLVVAAGNDGANLDKEPVYPAAYPQDNVLAVAATTSGGDLAGFSNFSSEDVDLGAPGEDVYSTYKDSGYRSLSGTSMAAPYVAAAAAMLRKQDSSLSYTDVRKVIKSTVDAVKALKGKTVTGGRLDLDAALRKVT